MFWKLIGGESLIQAKTKSRIAFTIAGVFLIVAAILGFLYFSMMDKANPDPFPGIEQVTTAESPFPDVDWDYWKSINPDIIGWVTVPETNIDQPIVQAHKDDPTFYLHHDIYKNYNVYGCPYLDAECEELGLNSKNAVVFGHHMNDGSVFSAFAEFSSQSFAEEHQKILLQTPDSKRILQVNFSRIINGAELLKRTSFIDDTDYRTWYLDELAAADAVVDDESVPTNNTTFVTCSYNRFSNERTLVYASLEVSYKVE